MKIYIYGAGAQGRVVADILMTNKKINNIEFIDDNKNLWGKKINNIKIVGGFDCLSKRSIKNYRIFIALGHPELRLKLSKRIRENRISQINVTHPYAVVTKTVTLGNGNMIGANAFINSNAKIGNNIIINNLSIIEHDCCIEDGATISSGVNLCGRVTVKQGAFISTGAIVLPRLTVGRFSVVAAGSLVTKNVENKIMVKGFPAKKIQSINKDFNWKKLL